MALITGCTTVEFVRKDLSPTKKGVLRFAPTSSESRQVKYREEVQKKATEFCGGGFEITKEYQALQETGRSAGVGTGFGVGFGGVGIATTNHGTAMYNFVEFNCTSPAAL